MSALYIHSLEGRLRIKISAVRAAPERAAHLKERFTGVAAIQEVQVNPVTGSVLFMYDPTGIRERDIIRMLQRLGWIPTPPVRPSVAPVVPTAHHETTGHRILEKVIAVLLELAFLRLLRLA